MESSEHLEGLDAFERFENLEVPKENHQGLCLGLGLGHNRRRRNKEPKDPNMPRKPDSAYMLFSKKVRKDVLKENPIEPGKLHETAQGFVNVARIIMNMWQDLSASEKAEFEKEAEILKTKYEIDLDRYKNSQI